jgi:hypothetical protein
MVEIEMSASDDRARVFRHTNIAAAFRAKQRRFGSKSGEVGPGSSERPVCAPIAAGNGRSPPDPAVAGRRLRVGVSQRPELARDACALA